MSTTLNQDDESTCTQKKSLNRTLPTVLCPVESLSDKSDVTKTADLPSSGSKLSLPSSLGTPTSPLRLSSPLSLPNSPIPFIRTTSLAKSATPIVNQSNNSLTKNEKQESLKQRPTNMESGSATGNPRNKCALQPGHSLMDWIRLGNSGKDLTGVGGRMRPVHPSELATHKTKNDAWLAIRGRVYNITYYLPYHPGGPDELMRGAGMDATELFDKVHPWVNYESLLAKCLVGPLRIDRPDAEELFESLNLTPKSERLREPSKAQELVRKSMENLANCITPVKKKMTSKSDEAKSSPPSKIMQSLINSSELPVSISRKAASSPVRAELEKYEYPNLLRTDWIQTSTKLTVSVYTGYLRNPGGCARLADGNLIIEVITDDWLRTLKVELECAVKLPLQLRVYPESGKLEVIALKEEAKLWNGCKISAVGCLHHITPRIMECTIEGVSPVSHDTMLLALKACSGPVVVPIGHHVRVHQTLAGTEYIRSYTPIGDYWGSDDVVGAPIKLAIKRYELGVLSPMLTSLKIGDRIKVSGPYGNFHLKKLQTVRKLYLLAAGTGITPMLSLLKFMLSRSNPRCESITLLNFNKTEEDILFRGNFEVLINQDDRLNVVHILSNGNATWAGRRGRISRELLTELLGDQAFSSDDDSVFACVCGPTEFTHIGVDILKKLGLKDKYLHAFSG